MVKTLLVLNGRQRALTTSLCGIIQINQLIGLREYTVARRGRFPSTADEKTSWKKPYVCVEYFKVYISNKDRHYHDRGWLARNRSKVYKESSVPCGRNSSGWRQACSASNPNRAQVTLLREKQLVSEDCKLAEFKGFVVDVISVVEERNILTSRAPFSVAVEQCSVSNGWNIYGVSWGYGGLGTQRHLFEYTYKPQSESGYVLKGVELRINSVKGRPTVLIYPGYISSRPPPKIFGGRIRVNIQDGKQKLNPQRWIK